MTSDPFSVSDVSPAVYFSRWSCVPWFFFQVGRSTTVGYGPTLRTRVQDDASSSLSSVCTNRCFTVSVSLGCFVPHICCPWDYWWYAKYLCVRPEFFWPSMMWESVWISAGNYVIASQWLTCLWQVERTINTNLYLKPRSACVNIYQLLIFSSPSVITSPGKSSFYFYSIDTFTWTRLPCFQNEIKNNKWRSQV